MRPPRAKSLEAPTAPPGPLTLTVVWATESWSCLQPAPLAPSLLFVWDSTWPSHHAPLPRAPHRGVPPPPGPTSAPPRVLSPLPQALPSVHWPPAGSHPGLDPHLSGALGHLTVSDHCDLRVCWPLWWRCDSRFLGQVCAWLALCPGTSCSVDMCETHVPSHSSEPRTSRSIRPPVASFTSAGAVSTQFRQHAPREDPSERGLTFSASCALHPHPPQPQTLHSGGVGLGCGMEALDRRPWQWPHGQAHRREEETAKGRVPGSPRRAQRALTGTSRSPKAQQTPSRSPAHPLRVLSGSVGLSVSLRQDVGPWVPRAPCKPLTPPTPLRYRVK